MSQLTKQPILDSDPTHSTRSRPFNERVSRVFAPPRPDTTPPEQRGPPRPTQHVALPSPRLLLTSSTVHPLLVPSCLSTSKHTSPTNCPTWRRIAGVGRAPKICSFHHDGQRVEAANPIATGYDGRSDKHGLQLFFQLISPMRSGTPPPPIAIFPPPWPSNRSRDDDTRSQPLAPCSSNFTLPLLRGIRMYYADASSLGAHLKELERPC